MKNRIFLGLSVILGMTALPAFAVDPLSAGSLQRYCEGATESVDEPEARLCFTYVNGFLDGAIVDRRGRSGLRAVNALGGPADR